MARTSVHRSLKGAGEMWWTLIWRAGCDSPVLGGKPASGQPHSAQNSLSPTDLTGAGGGGKEKKLSS